MYEKQQSETASWNLAYYKRERGRIHCSFDKQKYEYCNLGIFEECAFVINLNTWNFSGGMPT